MDESQSATILAYFDELNDPRVSRTRKHKLEDCLVIAICAVICGADGWTDVEAFGRAKHEWLKTFLELPNGIPSHDTFGRLFARLDPEQFSACFLRWIEAVRTKTAGEVVAIDGKVSRHSFDRAAGLGPLHTVSAWALENRLVLGQVKTDQKSNEITAIPQLLDLLDLSGCIVTIDAMGCQKKIAKQIVGKGSDYVLALKRNQDSIYRHVGAFFEWAEKKAFQGVTYDTFDTDDRGHGRTERRHYVVSTDVAWLPKRKAWKGLHSIGMVESERTKDGKTSTERRFFLSSLDALDARQFARAVRGHWQIENSLHWVLDLAFRDDDSRVRVGHAAENLEVLRHLALSLLKQETSEKRGIKGKRLTAGWNDAYLVTVLFG